MAGDIPEGAPAGPPGRARRLRALWGSLAQRWPRRLRPRRDSPTIKFKNKGLSGYTVAEIKSSKIIFSSILFNYYTKGFRTFGNKRS